MIFREVGFEHNLPRAERADNNPTPPPDFAVTPVDKPNRHTLPPVPIIDEAEQTAFFHRTLELMDKLDNTTERDAMIMNIQLWVTGGHTATAEWYQKIGEHLRAILFVEDIPYLTEQQRSAVTEFMKQAQLEFSNRPKDAGSTRRVSWRSRIFGSQ